MKKLLLTLSFIVACVSTKATPACLTNITVHALNGWTFTVVGEGGNCYQENTTYTNLSCVELLATSGSEGPVIIFSREDCPASGNNIASVIWDCNQGVICSGSQGGPMYCDPGSSFDISVPGSVNRFAVRLHRPVISDSFCCSLTWTEVFRTTCIPPAPHGEP